jgi:hypothetical protein
VQSAEFLTFTAKFAVVATITHSRLISSSSTDSAALLCATLTPSEASLFCFCVTSPRSHDAPRYICTFT